MIISVYLSDETALRLNKLSKEMGRTVEDLAECAVSEAALESFKHRKDDPANKRR